MANLIEMQKMKARESAFGKLMNDYSQPEGESEEYESPIQELLNELFEAQLQSKLFHWQTSSFAEHKALGEFYDGISDLVDEFVESYMGCYGRPMVDLEIEAKQYTMEAPMEFLKSFKEYLMGGARMVVLGNSALNNILDEMQSLTEKTLYLLSLK